MLGRRLAICRAAILVIVVGLALGPAVLAGDELFYSEENGTIVFTNMAQKGFRPVPGFGTRHRVVAAQPLPTTRHDRYIRGLADELGVSSDLIKAVAMVESGFDERARSPKGALGLMQLMPATARKYGVEDPFDPWQNLRGGAIHLSTLLDLYDGDLTLTLAAYNAGPAAVRRYRGVPPYRETRDYVRKVRNLLEGSGPARLPTGPADRPQPFASPVRVAYAPDGTIVLTN